MTDLLRHRATEQPAQRAYTYLLDGEAEQAHLSYAELDTRARALAARLAEAASSQDRVLLLLPPGLDYVTAFFGCLYAGVVAVPAYPPDPTQPERALSRLLAIVRDARPTAAVTIAPLLPYLDQLTGARGELHALRWIAVDETSPSDADRWLNPAPAADDIAMLQYTSGSTSAPKGVVLTHANLMHNSGLIQHFFRTSPASRGLVWLPPYHDMGLIGGLLQPLYAGFPVTLMSPLDFLQDPMRWLRAISRGRATVSGGPNFAYDLCIRKSTPEERAELDLSSWEVAFNGAEPIRRNTLERFAAAFAPAGFRPAAFVPCYGLAESTLLVAASVAPGDAGPTGTAPAEALVADAHVVVSSGQPAPGLSVAVVDPGTGVPCPPEEVGEIWISGASVARGYWEKPDETERVFGARLAPTGDGPYLRTGDLGFLGDAGLVVTGRLKDLVIVRGRNYYPHDIELAAQSAHRALRAGGSAAFVVESEDGEHLVVVQEVGKQQDALDVDAVSAAIRRAVVEQQEIQPHAVVLVRAGGVPKTSSGKVQRFLCREQFLAGALPEIGRDPGTASATPDLPPVAAADLLAAPPEQRPGLLAAFLRGHLAALCGIAPNAVDLDCPLVAAGLDSLAVQQFRHILEEQLAVRVPLGELLGGLTATDLAIDLATALDERDTAPAPAPEHPAGTHSPAGTTGGDRVAPLSSGQRAVWLLEQRYRGTSAHVVAAAFRVPGRVDRSALRLAVDTLVARHPAMRTTFGVRDGEPMQVVHEAGQSLVNEHDATGLDDGALRDVIDAVANRPFDLEHGPLLRIEVFARPDDDVVLVCAHHIIVDFWSMSVLAREFGALYGEQLGGPAAHLAAATSFLDVVDWQQQLLRDEKAVTPVARYASELVGNGRSALRLPRLAATASPLGRSLRFQVSSSTTRLLRERATREGVTLYVVLLAAYQALLHRMTGQDDLVVATPLAARTRPEFASVVGYCMNLVPIRSRAGDRDAFRDLLEQAKAHVVGALQYQDYPLAELAARDRVGAVRPSFEAAFVFNRSPLAGDESPAALTLGPPGHRVSLGPLAVERWPVSRRDCGFAIELAMAEIGGTLHASLQHRLDVIDEALAEHAAGQFVALLEAVARDPDQPISALCDAVAGPHPPVHDVSHGPARALGDDADVPRLFERQASRAPDAIAVTTLDGAGALTYRELNERANRLAHHLRECGIGPERRVGVCLDRSPDLVVALLAILKAGGGYVPVDPRHPAERIAATFVDADVTAVITQDRLVGKVGDAAGHLIVLEGARSDLSRQPAANPAPVAVLDDLAYVVYTSGSSGTPKGVEVTRRALANYVRFAVDHFHAGETDRVLQFASAGFDASAEEIYLALASGATLVLRDDGMLASPARFLADCAAAGVTVLDLPTAYWHELVAALDGGDASLPPAVRLVIVGGSEVHAEKVATWRRLAGTAVRLVNTYGPTEATIVATTRDLTDATGVPIGRPVANASMYVLDERRRPVPVGHVGEIYLGGAGLARGYRDKPGLTAERFVPDPYGPPGTRLYRTGDLARYRPDGEVDFVGRADRQVKLRGYRVEPAEVEAVLRRHDAVADAAVTVTPLHDALIAHVVPVASAAPDSEALRALLRASLPEYMVPRHVVSVLALPRTPNGKVDYAVLAAHEPPRCAPVPEDLPRSDTERVLAGIWTEVLGVTDIGRHDDFFALGGSSLLVAKMLARVTERFSVDVPMDAVFGGPTLAAVAALVSDAPRRFDPITRAPRDQPLPLSFAQERVWFLQQLEPESTAYNVPRALRVRGPVDEETLAGALADLEARHEILRTTFQDIDGVPVQVIDEPRGVPLRVVDLSGQDDVTRELEAMALVAANAREPFDLTTGPLLRVTLIRLAPDDHVLVLVEHHLVHDGWAQGVFLRDFLEFYDARATGRAPALPELRVQYADFAAWQQRTLRGDRLAGLLEYWRQRLAGAPAELDLPTDRPRPYVLSYRGDQQSLVIDSELADALRQFCRDTNVTLFMATYATFATLLHGYTATPDLVVATGFANRQREDVEHLLGMVINTLLLRTELSGDLSFETLLNRVRETCLEAYAHGDMPFEKLVQHLKPTRRLDHVPLFQVMFSFLDTPMPSLEVAGLSFEVIPIHNGTAKFDLNIVVVPHSEQRAAETPRGRSASPSAGEITLYMEYSTDLFDASTVRRMLGEFEALLRAAIARPHASLAQLLDAAGRTPPLPADRQLTRPEAETMART